MVMPFLRRDMAVDSSFKKYFKTATKILSSNLSALFSENEKDVGNDLKSDANSKTMKGVLVSRYFSLLYQFCSVSSPKNMTILAEAFKSANLLDVESLLPYLQPYSAQIIREMSARNDGKNNSTTKKLETILSKFVGLIRNHVICDTT